MLLLSNKVKISVSNKIRFTQVVSNIFRAMIERDNKKVMLGRWGLSEHKNTHLVVDYSNEDHCGTCSQYALEKQELKKKLKHDDELFKYELECLSSNTQQNKN